MKDISLHAFAKCKVLRGACWSWRWYCSMSIAGCTRHARNNCESNWVDAVRGQGRALALFEHEAHLIRF
eukprot:675646-Amphidinium_carterae.2